MANARWPSFIHAKAYRKSPSSTRPQLASLPSALIYSERLPASGRKLSGHGQHLTCSKPGEHFYDNDDHSCGHVAKKPIRGSRSAPASTWQPRKPNLTRACGGFCAIPTGN